MPKPPYGKPVPRPPANDGRATFDRVRNDPKSQGFLDYLETPPAPVAPPPPKQG